MKLNTPSVISLHGWSTGTAAFEKTVNLQNFSKGIGHLIMMDRNLIQTWCKGFKTDFKMPN